MNAPAPNLALLRQPVARAHALKVIKHLPAPERFFAFVSLMGARLQPKLIQFNFGNPQGVQRAYTGTFSAKAPLLVISSSFDTYADSVTGDFILDFTADDDPARRVVANIQGMPRDFPAPILVERSLRVGLTVPPFSDPPGSPGNTDPIVLHLLALEVDKHVIRAARSYFGQLWATIVDCRQADTRRFTPDVPLEIHGVCDGNLDEANRVSLTVGDRPIFPVPNENTLTAYALGASPAPRARSNMNDWAADLTVNDNSAKLGLRQSPIVVNPGEEVFLDYAPTITNYSITEANGQVCMFGVRR